MSTEHASLEFSVLPLTRVECTLLPDGAIPLDFSSGLRVRDSVSKALPIVSEFSIPSAAAFSISIQGGPGFVFEDQEGLRLEVRQGSVMSRWDAGRKPYVRYKALKRLLIDGAAASGGKFLIARMAYLVNFNNTDNEFNVWDLLAPSIFPERVKGEVPTTELMANYSTSSGEFKYQINLVQGPATAPALQILTIGGKAVGDGTIGDALDDVHRTMISEFKSMISEDAVNKWGLYAGD